MPWTSKRICFYARQNGKYNRPIIGHLIDFRIEDILNSQILKQVKGNNVIGKLPDIPEANQVNKYFLSIFNNVDIISGEKAAKLLKTNEFIVLPVDDTSDLWSETKAPWWEFVVVLDEYEAYIKAPKINKIRPGEPSPDEIDEMLDNYEENIGKLQVLSPITFKKWQDSNIKENYYKKLKRI